MEDSTSEYVMLLNDGETWTSLAGCQIIEINGEADEPANDDLTADGADDDLYDYDYDDDGEIDIRSALEQGTVRVVRVFDQVPLDSDWAVQHAATARGGALVYVRDPWRFECSGGRIADIFHSSSSAPVTVLQVGNYDGEHDRQLAPFSRETLALDAEEWLASTEPDDHAAELGLIALPGQSRPLPVPGAADDEGSA